MPHDDMHGRRAVPTPLQRTRLLRAALGVAFVAVLCAQGSLARAADDDDESVFGQFMQSLGLRHGGGGIDYTERSPLVVPPTRDLPRPIASAPPAVPDWPKDPDIKRRTEVKKKEKPHYQADYVTESSRPLRPDELDKGRAPSSNTGPNGGVPDAMANPADFTRSKKNAFNFDWLKKEDYATFTGEPTRGSLTDPPAGYLTPSPDQPYGISPDRKVYKPQSVGERMELPR